MRFRFLELYGSARIVDPSGGFLRRYGVPVGGPMDFPLHSIANALCGNPPEMATLELELAVGRLEVLESGSFAWVGAGATNARIWVNAGDTVQLPYPESGCRSYVAAPGGVSRREDGTIFGCEPGLRAKLALAQPFSLSSRELQVVRRSAANLGEFEAVVSGVFEVSRDSNRVGIRLMSSSPVGHSFDLPSEPTDVGLVQWLPSGDLIVMGPDGPTIGGYPKIAAVIEADLPILGQLRPGDRIGIREVSEGEAAFLNSDASSRLRKLLSMISIPRVL